MEIIDSENFKAVMIQRCIGVSQLAKLANVQTKIISRFLKSDSNIRLSTLGKICKALKIEPAKILKESDSDETQSKNLSA